jgi:hypothetical protein
VERIWKSQYRISSLETIIENDEVKIITPVIEPKITMGVLFKKHIKAIFSLPNEQPPKEETTQFSIKTSFHLSGDGTLSEDRKKRVLELVTERNELAHSILEKFDHITGVGCRELCVLLDEQNYRILEEIEFLNTMSTSYKEAIIELQKNLEAEEFIREIENKFPTNR